MPINAVFFDLDGTLADYESSAEAAFDEAYALVTRYHPQLQKRDFSSRFDATLRISVEAEMRGLPQYVSRRDRFRETWQRRGYPDNPLADRLADVYGTVRLSSLALYPDATVVLEDLRLKKALGLVTNGPAAVQRGQIQALDLDRYFRHILVSGEVGYSKPHTEIFRRALELAEVTREEALFVGDTPETDIAGAQQVGMQTVWLNRRGRRWPANLPEPAPSIASLQELLRLV